MRRFLIAFIAAQIALGQIFVGFAFNFSCSAQAQTSTESKANTEIPTQIKRVKAPPLEGGVGYLNSDKPISLERLAGRFVVLDFWTFCCINCMHILPMLAELEQKYGDKITVVGIHSAKFENEKDTSNISKAILRYGIKHPVINDADFKIWDAYGVQAWPTLVLIDPEGYIIGRFSGEGHTPEISAWIDKLSPIYNARGSLKTLKLLESAERKSQKESSVPAWISRLGPVYSATGPLRTKEKAEAAEKKSLSELSFPGKVAFTPDEMHLLISDTGHNRIIVAKLDDFNHATVETIIGKGDAALKDGTFSEACFNHPQGICADLGNWSYRQKIYVADTLNHAIRVIDLSKKSVTTLCGNGHEASVGAGGGPFTQAILNSPWDLTFVSSTLYIAMAGSHQVWVAAAPSFLPDEGAVLPYAGSGREDIIDGTLNEAALAQPSGITYGLSSSPATKGNSLYVADAEDSGIREINIAEGKVSTLIGKGLFVFGDADGPAATARLQHPLGVSAEGYNLYVADSYNHKIKWLDLKAKTIATLAGTGKSGYKDGDKAQFAEPGGLAVGNGKIYVADTNNSVIRVITLPTTPGGEVLTDTLKLVWKR